MFSIKRRTEEERENEVIAVNSMKNKLNKKESRAGKESEHRGKDYSIHEDAERERERQTVPTDQAWTFWIEPDRRSYRDRCQSPRRIQSSNGSCDKRERTWNSVSELLPVFSSVFDEGSGGVVVDSHLSTFSVQS